MKNAECDKESGCEVEDRGCSHGFNIFFFFFEKHGFNNFFFEMVDWEDILIIIN